MAPLSSGFLKIKTYVQTLIMFKSGISTTVNLNWSEYGLDG